MRVDAEADNTLQPSPKWVRAFADGKLVADSKEAHIVRPPEGPPLTYAFPPEAVKDAPDGAKVAVDGMIALQWDEIDHWFEESEEVFVHPRDPDKRIDALHSSRHVVVEVDGEVLAESRRPVVLIEAFPYLPLRYYLPPDDVELTRLAGPGKKTACPYKGWAKHHHFRAGDKVHEDLAWMYRAPLREVEPIRGRYAFYNERVDLTIDGERLERPKTPFS